MRIPHFITGLEYAHEQTRSLIGRAFELKRGASPHPASRGKVLALLFFNPSLRTRLSFTSGIHRLGGTAVELDAGSAYTFEFREGVVMDGAAIEHVREASRVISRYADVIGIRSSELITNASESAKTPDWSAVKKDVVLSGFARHATVPVVNLESNVWHPCQGLGDAMTLAEHLAKPQGKKYVLTWSYHPKALPVATPHSQALAACDLGMEVVVAHPPGWELDPEYTEILTARAKEAGGSFSTTTSQEDAFADARVVTAKSWGALSYYGRFGDEKKLRDTYKNWMVDEKKMARTDNAYFMHCLPVRRNVKASDAVLDSPRSLIIDEAENRMWAQMALLEKLFAESNL